MSKKETFPLEYHLIYLQKANGSQKIIFDILKSVTDQGKIKYTLHKKFPSGIDGLEKSIRRLQRENPNLKVGFWTKKEFRKNKELTHAVSRYLCSNYIGGSCIIILATLIEFFFTRTNLIYGHDLFMVLSVVNMLNSMSTFRNNNYFVKNLFSKSKKSIYLLELCYMLFLSIFPASLYQEKLNMGVNATSNVQMEVDQNSPFFGLDSTNEKIDVLYNTLRNNSKLSEEEYESFEIFREYYEKNPYLDYEKVNKRYKNLDIRSDVALSGAVCGQTFILKQFPFSIVRIKVDHQATPSTVYHEEQHLTGGFPFRFLNEGMTVCLTEEFYPYEKDSLTEHYYQAGLFVRLLAEIVGSDPCLKAYSEESMGAINDALLEIIPDKNVLSQFYRAMEDLDSSFLKLQKIYSSDSLLNNIQSLSTAYDSYIYNYWKLFQILSLYSEQKLGVSLDDESLCNGDHLCQKYASIILRKEEKIEEKQLKRYFNG